MATPLAVAAPVEYAAALEPLLDLVPGEDDHFIALRDADALLRLFDAFVGVATPSVLERFSDDADVKEARVVLEEVAKLRDALIAAKVDLDKGVLFLEGPGAIVYGVASDDPSAIKVAMKAVGVKDDDLPPTCVAPAAMPGYAACGEDEAVLKALTPGKHGAAYAAAYGERLTGFDLDRGNAFFRLEGPSGPVVGAVATPPGRLHLAVSLADVGQELGKYVEAGVPQSLGLLSPGAAFVWTKVQLSAFEQQIQSAPGPVQNVAATLTGEVVAGGIRQSAGGVLVGVDDPFPASGLVSLASLQTDMIKSQLPENSEVKVEGVEAGGTTTQALHVTFGLDAAGKTMVDTLKLEPSAWGFSAGKYAGFVIGGTDDAVKAVASYEPKAAPLSGVPENLAAAMRSGDVALAVYLPFDALQAATIRSTLMDAIASAPGPKLADPKIIEAAYDAASPLSSLSMWLTHPANERVLHLSIESFGDATTPEGKDALEALGKVIAGADPKATYAALAAEHASSPRAHRYRVRAGDIEGGVGPAAMSASFLLGAVAGISVPAFTKYIDRSRAAAEQSSP
ncbi:MAG: hypothetical protein ACE37F_00025 [Nannocystaceae bacterium]|nr:hypothetical protein [bacterium]